MLLRERQLDLRSADGRRQTARLRSLPFQQIRAAALASLQRSMGSRSISPSASASDKAELLRDPIATLSKVFFDMERPEGRQRLADYFARRPYPRFMPIKDDPTAFVRVDEDGKRTAVRFMDGEFREDA